MIKKITLVNKLGNELTIEVSDDVDAKALINFFITKQQRQDILAKLRVALNS